jgi:hypothetical protein
VAALVTTAWSTYAAVTYRDQSDCLWIPSLNLTTGAIAVLGLGAFGLTVHARAHAQILRLAIILTVTTAVCAAAWTIDVRWLSDIDPSFGSCHYGTGHAL